MIKLHTLLSVCHPSNMPVSVLSYLATTRLLHKNYYLWQRLNPNNRIKQWCFSIKLPAQKVMKWLHQNHLWFQNGLTKVLIYGKKKLITWYLDQSKAFILKKGHLNSTLLGMISKCKSWAKVYRCYWAVSWNTYVCHRAY